MKSFLHKPSLAQVKFLQPHFCLLPLLIIGAFTISGCANTTSTTMPVEMSTLSQKKSKNQPYTPRIIQFEDKRTNRKIGNMGGRTVDSDIQPIDWVQDSLKNRGYVFSNETMDDSQNYCDITLDVNILDLQSVNTSKTANIVFTLTHAELPDPKIIRGRSTSMLWAYSNYEMAGALGKALSRAIDELDETLIEVCA